MTPTGKHRSPRSNIGAADIVRQEISTVGTSRRKRRFRRRRKITPAFVVQPHTLHQNCNLPDSAPYQSLLDHYDKIDELSVSIDVHAMPCDVAEAIGDTDKMMVNSEGGISVPGATCNGICNSDYNATGRDIAAVAKNCDSTDGGAVGVKRDICNYRTANLNGGTADSNMTLKDIAGRRNQQGGPAFITLPPIPIAAASESFYHELEPTIESQNQLKCEKTTTTAATIVFTKTTMKPDTMKQGDNFGNDNVVCKYEKTIKAPIPKVNPLGAHPPIPKVKPLEVPPIPRIQPFRVPPPILDIKPFEVPPIPKLKSLGFKAKSNIHINSDTDSAVAKKSHTNKAPATDIASMLEKCLKSRSESDITFPEVSYENDIPTTRNAGPSWTCLQAKIGSATHASVVKYVKNGSRPNLNEAIDFGASLKF